MLDRRMVIGGVFAGAVSATVPAQAATGFMSVRLVMVGGSNVGKTSALISYMTNLFPEELHPPSFRDWTHNTLYDNRHPVSYDLNEVPASEDYDRLRPLSYPNTDVFALTYSVTSSSSLAEAVERFAPEIRHHSPNTPIMLLGLRADLRNETDTNFLDQPVTQQAVSAAAAQVGASASDECSALTQQNLAAVFQRMIGLASGLSPAGPARQTGRRPTQLPDRFRPVDRRPNQRGGY